MAFLSSLDIPTMGMSAERFRLELIGQNIAFSKVTSTSDGTPYTRQVAVFSEIKEYDNLDIGNFVNRKINSLPTDHAFSSVLEMTMAKRNSYTGKGVVVSEVWEDPTPYTPVYDPSHPDADEDGYYYLPNVDVEEEQMDAVAASNSYDANLTIFNSMKKMAQQALTIGEA